MNRTTLRPGRSKLLVAFAAAAAFAVSFAVSPAMAGNSGQASWTDSCGADVFNSLDSLASGSSLARGGPGPREPGLDQLHTEAPAAVRKGNAPFVVNVPTWVHVVSLDGVTGNVSDAAIQSQMQVLNTTFGGFEPGGHATGFSFTLAGVTRTVNAAWHNAGPSSREERAMKQALKRGGDNTLNVYLTTAGIYLGWAYLPNVTDHGNSYLDGIVVDWESVPGTSPRYAGRYDLGETATHEAGHWLNLEHTFFGGCNAHGDFIADTPAMKDPTNGCPAGKDTCPKKPGPDPIHNYMDYSYDACYTQFTPGQATRMQDAWAFWRA